MIEVTQKDRRGRIQTLGFYTEEDFGFAYRRQFRDIINMFGTEHKMIGSHKEPIGDRIIYRMVADFSMVAYNEKGKVLDPTYLLGLAREALWQHRYSYYSWIPGTKSNWHRGCRMRQMHTTPERRATFACEDQEEHAPKIRGRRKNKSLPESYHDYGRFNQKNWKKFRNHQWKE